MIMKKYLCLIFVLLLIMLSGCKKKDVVIINKVINQEPNIEEEIIIKDFSDLVESKVEFVSQSVVGIKASSSTAIFENNSYGSGVVIKQNKDNEYYIVTSRHVVCPKKTFLDNIEIYLGNLDLYIPASLLSYSEQLDLALLKVETKITLKPALIEQKELKIGMFVISIGSPYDLEKYYNSVNLGNISGLNRIQKETMLDGNVCQNIYFQHNALINNGDSGGGVFDLNGNLIGINTWKLVNQNSNIVGMSFAIEIKEVTSCFSSYLS